jgi:hypothetical protein
MQLKQLETSVVTITTIDHPIAKKDSITNNTDTSISRISSNKTVLTLLPVKAHRLPVTILTDLDLFMLLCKTSTLLK